MAQAPKAELPPELADIKPPIQLRISRIASYVLYVWVLIGIIALASRLFLLLFSANPATPFVHFIYRLSNDYLDPFRGIFPPHQVGETGYFDVAALFAIFIYLILAWLAGSLIRYVQAKVDANDHEQRVLLAYQQAEATKTQKTT